MCTIPLFAELRSFLEDTFDPEAVHVIARYRDTNANLRTRRLRIIMRAGVEPWEQLFHNLRASRQTELENEFPSHVVCAWMENSEAVARRHYLQVTDDHFTEAVRVEAKTGGAGGGAIGVQKPVLQASAQHRTESQETKKASGVTAIMPLFPEAFDSAQAPPRGVEPLSSD